MKNLRIDLESISEFTYIKIIIEKRYKFSQLSLFFLKSIPKKSGKLLKSYKIYMEVLQNYVKNFKKKFRI